MTADNTSAGPSRAQLLKDHKKFFSKSDLKNSDTNESTSSEDIPKSNMCLPAPYAVLQIKLIEKEAMEDKISACSPW